MTTDPTTLALSGSECLLVPVDGSAASRRAVRSAISVGRSFAKPVRPLPVADDGGLEGLLAELKAAYPTLRPADPVGGDDLGPAMLGRADEVGGLLVAAGDLEHHRGHRRTLASRLATDASRPLLVVGPEVSRPVRDTPDRLVVPVVGRDDRELVEVAGSVASAFGLTLNLVGVDQPDPRASPRHDPASTLAAFAALVGDHPITVATEVVRDPLGPVYALSSLLRFVPGALLTVRRGGSAGPYVRQSPVPVLVVP